MKTTTNRFALIPRLYCSIFGHNFKVSKKITLHVKEYTCKRCGKEVTTNSNGKLTELTPKYREINAILSRVHIVRAQRLKKLKTERLKRAI